MTRVGVLGAAGLVGGEAIRLIAGHPGLDLTYLGGERHAGQRLSAVHPGLRLSPDPVIENLPAAQLARVCDAVICATPAVTSAAVIPELARHGTVVIDLSGAFRLRDEALHQRWYPDVQRPGGLADRFVFGVPELLGARLADAALISLPGCYATAALLALAPLVQAARAADLRLGPLLIDAKGGSSGGGLALREADLHPHRSGAITPYAPDGHRHAAEVDRFFAEHAPGRLPRTAMSAYGTGTVRGLLASCYAFTDEPRSALDAATLRRAYLRFYRPHPFVRVRHRGDAPVPAPTPKAVTGSNYCDVMALYDAEGRRVIALGALDNLLKGAAGQAVQVLNLRFGHGETTGLDAQPLVVS
ncbi:N-acetyl-gamma-glutamyl-phosphate reductase [Streptomyces sp. ODS28]|uniref:N-acetyl-gamma-glutamyl-phosphate reductase n=1 Tax=Streptomyces sp. ODS28 TaxID=3136688 RepID=UPI0031EE8BCE